VTFDPPEHPVGSTSWWSPVVVLSPWVLAHIRRCGAEEFVAGVERDLEEGRIIVTREVH